VEARLVSAPWGGETALVYVLRRAGAGIDERREAGELALRDAEAVAREMRAILDTATDGVALLDREGRVLGMNRSAEALFGFDSGEIEGRNFTTLFAPESHRAAMDYLDGLATNGVASVLNDGREVIGRVREGGLIPLFMTLGRVAEAGQKFCAVFRDITQWKRAEEELVHARRQAERANTAKSEFLAKISHEIRTPLNAIIGFAEVMMEERLGPVGNERYRGYLKDIHTSGGHLISLINDLLDLSKIEAGKLELNFASVDLNEIASQSMALMQPQANRERIIIRTALSTSLPPVVADARSIRQIVLNLLSNSIRFTPPGGQVIVSTTLTDDGEVHLRVRDTGIGMTDSEIKTALEPFRQIATSGRGKESGTGLGLPLTKALVEANRASFSIKSTVNAGTLVEIAFPSTRVLAE
jgi:PAS domain S-box-containing protein